MNKMKADHFYKKLCKSIVINFNRKCSIPGLRNLKGLT